MSSPSGHPDSSRHTWSPSNIVGSNAGRPPSLTDQQQSLPNVVRVVVTRDNGGYGMKVSGDNPVYVQSVKEGGPAEKAGLHAGDKIIQVNGSNVMHSTHTEVVALIKSTPQVVLTVQQRLTLHRNHNNKTLNSPTTRITGPQPVDNEKQHQLQQEKEQYYRLMIEQEQHHLDKLRSEMATTSSSNEKKNSELAKAEKNLRILQDNLSRTRAEQHSPEITASRFSIIPSPTSIASHSTPHVTPLPCSLTKGQKIDNNKISDLPPPLPKRNKSQTVTDINSLFLSNEIINNNNNNSNNNANNGQEKEQVDNNFTYSGDCPPPLPPRTYPPCKTTHNTDDTINSIDKQFAYPLVATCTSLIKDSADGHQIKHHRTKSSPEPLMTLNNTSFSHMEHNLQRPGTPPGTPPPPYPCPGNKDKLLMSDLCNGSFDITMISPEETSLDSPNSFFGSKLFASMSPIRAANSRVAQQTIISMEDDDMSDLEIDQNEDHGHFKSLSKLWEHLPHLAVFMNYILSNSDASSLLFYLLTDLYKEGNAKDMRKWAFEIHSCFLVPGAPLRLNNVDENVAREIDDNLTKEYDKEEIMRRIFWKARNRAKEELTKQLIDFQHKRTAGLGTIYGPSDQELMDVYNDKTKEMKLYENLFLPIVDLYIEEVEKEHYDPHKYYLAAALITVLTRVFRVRPPNLEMDRVPIFVNKDRSIKLKFMGKYLRKLSYLNHQFVPQQYFIVMPCSYCQQIIYGISPQGYQCSACLINLHRPCVKLYDDTCPGPITKRERGIRKLIGMRHDSADQNKMKKSGTSHFIQVEKDKRQLEEKDNRSEHLETECRMWSKQQQVNEQQSKNMTFKNKIINRKNKNANNNSSNKQTNPSILSDASNDSKSQVTTDEKLKQQQQQGNNKQVTNTSTSQRNKNRGRNRNKKDATKALDKNAEKINKEKKKGNEKGEQQQNNKKTTNETGEDVTDDCVVLRHPNNDNNNKLNNEDATLKRYSDSFIIENNMSDKNNVENEKETKTSNNNNENSSSSNPTPLTRALSGFFVTDHSKRSSRRFSDLFRPTNGRISSGGEHVNAPTSVDKNSTEKKDKHSVTNSSSSSSKVNNKKSENAQTKSSKFSSNNENSISYLKKVKSKIYKSKSDDYSKIELENNKYKMIKPKKSLTINSGRIPEEEVPLSPSSSALKTDIPKSLSHFHFTRLTRQTTNLEQISRPFGSQKSVELTVDKPLLAKAKSSSAINLSLLRTRRAKLMEQITQSNAASPSATYSCKDEFDFIAFGGLHRNHINNSNSCVDQNNHSGSTTSLHKFPSWLCISKGESKISKPVSRSGSDRRTQEEGAGDTISSSSPSRDGVENLNESTGHCNETAMTPVASSDSPSGELLKESASSQKSSSKKSNSTHINRSESVKEQSEKNKKQQQRRNVSDPSHNHNKTSIVDFGRQSISKNLDSGSSSTSSISFNGRLSESPSTSMDVHQATVRSNSDSGTDVDEETDPLNWQELLTEEELKKLNVNEKKRQEVINELFTTEASHVRMLKVLYKLFYKTLFKNQVLKNDELNLIFPNIKDLLDIHLEIYKEMRQIRKEDSLARKIGDMLLNTFTGARGEALQKAAATFCESQQLALEFIKKRRERDSKFDSLLIECEKERKCRRLQLQGILPVEMQRLVGYPLLLERLIKSVKAADKGCIDYKEESEKLEQVLLHSKKILSFVNTAAALTHNRHRLEEIQRHLDMSNFKANDHPIVNDFKNVDLTRYNLIFEGTLHLRRNNKAPVPVHILILEEIVVILQKENEKFLLKFFQTVGQPSLPPIIKMSTLLVRENAACKNALFLVNTSTTSIACMYDLQAEDEIKRELWCKHFSDAVNMYHGREGKASHTNYTSITTTPNDPIHYDSDSNSIRESCESVNKPSGPSVNQESTEEVTKVTEEVQTDEDNDQKSDTTAQPASTEAEKEGNDKNFNEEDMAAVVIVGGDGSEENELTTKVTAEDWPLIQPSQVNVTSPPVLTAESMLTPLEQIRRKDAIVKQALLEKEELVADQLGIPRAHFQYIADISSTTVSDSSVTESLDINDCILASIVQVNKLLEKVNDAYNISDSQVLAAKGGKLPACASQEEPQYANNEFIMRSGSPGVLASLTKDIVTPLSSQLTTLLSKVKQMEEERDLLRKEVHKLREKIHEEHNLHSPVPFDDTSDEIFCEASSEEPQ